MLLSYFPLCANISSCIYRAFASLYERLVSTVTSLSVLTGKELLRIDWNSNMLVKGRDWHNRNCSVDKVNPKMFIWWWYVCLVILLPSLFLFFTNVVTLLCWGKHATRVATSSSENDFSRVWLQSDFIHSTKLEAVARALAACADGVH